MALKRRRKPSVHRRKPSVHRRKTKKQRRNASVHQLKTAGQRRKAKNRRRNVAGQRRNALVHRRRTKVHRRRTKVHRRNAAGRTHEKKTAPGKPKCQTLPTLGPSFGYFTTSRRPPRLMENERLAARLRRDTTTAAFLARARPRYTEIEDDVAPHRTDLAANLVKADALKGQVLDADADNNAPRKQGTRSQLTALLLRRVKALRAHAKGVKPEPDTELAATLPTRPADLRRLTEGEFPVEARRLLGLGGAVKPTDLTKRRYTPDHQTQAQKLLKQLADTTQEGATNDDLGATGRQALERLIKADTRLIAALEEFFAPYNDPDDEDALALYKDWRQAVAVNYRGGHDGPLGAVGEQPKP